MDSDTLSAIEETCRHTKPALKAILTQTVNFSEKHFKNSKAYDQLWDDFNDAMTTEEKAILATEIKTLLLTAVQVNRPLAEKFIQKHLKEFGEAERTLLNIWRQTPPKWVAAKIIAQPAADLFLLKDIAEDEELLLHSTAMSEALEQVNPEHIVCIGCLYFNGDCWEQIGRVNCYLMLEEDLFWYIESYRRRTPKDFSLTRAILDNYHEFFSLDTLAGGKITSKFGEPDCVYWAEMPVTSLSLTLPGRWERIEKGAYEMLTYEKPDDKLLNTAPPTTLIAANLDPKKKQLWDTESFLNPEIYLDKITHTLLIFAYSKYDFHLCCALLQQSFAEELPEFTREGRMSKMMHDFYLDNPHFTLPIDSYFEVFGNADNLGTAQLLYSAITEEKLNTMADLFKFSPEERENILQNFRSLHRAIEGKITLAEGEENYFLAPEPVLTGELMENSTFQTDDSPLFKNTYDHEYCIDLYASLTERDERTGEFAHDPTQFYHGLFIDFQPGGSKPRMIMHAFLYMLNLYGNEWHEVRSYALELIRGFSTFIIPGGEAYEEFIREFSNFVYRRLCRHGLTMINARVKAAERAKGLFTIKRTELVTALFPLTEEFTRKTR